jgi:hypothetical protein
MEYEIITSQDGNIAKLGFKFINSKVYNIKPLIKLKDGGLYPKGWYARPNKADKPWLEYRGPDEDCSPINNLYENAIIWFDTPFVACEL